MAEEVFIKKSVLTDIADAIREKNGRDETYMPYEFSSAIDDLPGEEMSDLEKYIRGGEILYSGYNGDCPWAITDHGTLVIGDPDKVTYLSEEYLTNPWSIYNSEIKNIVFNGKVVVPEDMTNMFSGMSELWLVFNIGNLDTSLVKSFQGWFQGCLSINTIDLTSWDASNVRILNWMFKNCSCLVEVKLPTFYHECEMIGMFSQCGFVNFRFYGDKVLRSSNMTQMFSECPNLVEANLQGIDISKITYMQETFAYCPNLTTVNIEPIFAPNLVSMKNMFTHCYSLKTNPKNLFWKVPSLEDVSFMFHFCISLDSFEFDSPVFSIKNITGMFAECYKLRKIDWTNWINFFYAGEETLHANSPFHNCWNLQELITGSRTMLSTKGWQIAHFDAYAPKQLLHTVEGIKPALSRYTAVHTSTTSSALIGYNIASVPGYELINSFEAGLRVDWRQAYNKAITFLVMDLTTGNMVKEGVFSNMNTQFSPPVNLPYQDYIQDSYLQTYIQDIYKMMVDAGMNKDAASSLLGLDQNRNGYLRDIGLALPYYMVEQNTGIRTFQLTLNQPCHYIREDTYVPADPFYKYPAMHNFLGMNFSDYFSTKVVKHIEWRTNVLIPLENKLPSATSLGQASLTFHTFENSLSWEFDHDTKTLIIATPEDEFYLPPDSSGMFSGMIYLEDFSFKNLNTKYCCSFDHMFYDCSRLKEITDFNMNPSILKTELVPFQDICDITDLEDVINYNKTQRGNNIDYELNNSEGTDAKYYDWYYIYGVDTMFKNCSDLRLISFENVDWGRTKSINRALYSYSSTLRKALSQNLPTANVVIINKSYEKSDGYEQLTTDEPWYKLPLNNDNEVILSKYDTTKESIIPNFNINVTGLIDGPGKYIRERAITQELLERTYGVDNNIFYSGMALRNMIENYSAIKGISLQEIKSIDFRTRIVSPHGTQYVTTINDVEYIGPYIYYNSDTKKIIIQTRAENFVIRDNAEYTFYDMRELRRINNFNKIQWENITNISHLFDGCFSLITIDLSNLELQTLTDTSYMFNNCELFDYVDLSHFNFSNVIDMEYMFNGCKNLKELILPENIDTSKVTDMTHLFSNCESLSLIDFKNFDTDNVIDMSYMFYNCASLLFADLSNFNTINVQDMSYMFTGCNSLREIDVSSIIFPRKKDYIFAWLPDIIYKQLTAQFNKENIYFNNLFEGCLATQLDLSNFNWHMARDIKKMFKDCVNLQSLDMGDVESPWPYSTNRMFLNCESLTSITFDRWRTRGVTDIEAMFSGCKSLVDLNFAKIEFHERLIKASMLFMDCEALSALDMSNCYLYCNFDRIFYNCKSLTAITDLHGQYVRPLGQSFYYKKPEFTGRFFYNCESLENLDLSYIKFNDVYNYTYMFYNCKSLEEINLKYSNVFNGPCYEGMFKECINIKHIILPEKINLAFRRYYTSGGWTYYVDRHSNNQFKQMFYNCESLIDITNLKSITTNGQFDKSSNGSQNMVLWNLNQTFYNCKNLEMSIDFSKFISKIDDPNAGYNWITGSSRSWLQYGGYDIQLTSLKETFYNCHKITSIKFPDDRPIDITNYSTTQEFEGTFDGCYNLENLVLVNLKFGSWRGPTTEYSPSEDTSNSQKYWFTRMFKDCRKLREIDLSTWMFQTYHNLAQATGLPYNNNGNLGLTTEDIGNMSSMFENCYELEKIIWPKGIKSTGVAPTYDLVTKVFPFMYIKNADKMFKNCYKLTEIKQECYPEIIFNTVVSAYQMMMNCKAIETNIVLLCSNYLRDMREIFSGCESMTYLDFRKHRTLFNYTEKENGLYNCLAMQQMDIGQFYDTARNAEIEGYSIKHLSDASWSIDLNNQWIEDDDNAINGSQVYKSNSNYHVANGNAYCYLTIQGYSRFSIRVRSNGESNYDYLIVSKLDQTSGLSTSNCEYHTYGKPSTTYTTVVYEIYDDNPHIITLLYRKDSSVDSNEDRAFFYVSPTYLDYNIVLYPMQFPKDMYTGVQNMYTVWNEDIPIKVETYYDFPLLPEKYNSRLISGSEFSYTIKRMANGSNVTDGNFEDTKIKHIIFENGVQKSGTAIGSQGSPVVANWDNNTGTITITFEVAAPIILNANSMNMFYKLKGLQSIEGLDILDTSEVLNANGMFREMGTSSLELDLRTWDMSNCTNMQNIFTYCTANLVNITDWDITSLLDIIDWSKNYVFFDHAKITTLNAENLDFSNITNLCCMFINAEIPNLNIQNWNVSNIGNFRSVFDRLKTNILNINTWDTSSGIYMSYMFQYGVFNNIIFDQIDTSNVIDMQYMFAGCAVFEINISTWNISNVITTYRMFYDTKIDLTTITLLNFNAEVCTNMSQMFYNCRATTITLSNFNVETCLTMYYMFFGTSNLQNLNITSEWKFNANNDVREMFNGSTCTINTLENFNVSSLVNLYRMFYGYKGTELIFTNWNTSNCLYMSEMFAECTNLITLKIQTFDTSKVRCFEAMFYNCPKLETFETNSFILNANDRRDSWYINSISGNYYLYNRYISTSSYRDWGSFNSGRTPVGEMFLNITIPLNISHWDVSKQIVFSTMFGGYKGTTIDLSQWNIQESTINIIWRMMFNNCSNIQYIYLTSFWTENVSDMAAMFANCISLIKVYYRDNICTLPSVITNAYGMYVGCTCDMHLEEWDVSKLTTWASLFRSYRGTTIDLSSWNNKYTSDIITSINAMFYDCNNLTTLILGGFNNQRIIKDFGASFAYCSSLITVDITSIHTDLATSFSSMFYASSKLETLDFSNFSTENVTTMYRMFYDCQSLRELDLTSFNTIKCSNFYQMFYNCKSLQHLLIPNFNTSLWSGDNAIYMFCHCESLEELYLPDTFTMINNTSAERMFQWCYALQSIRIPETFGGANLQRADGMFEGCNVLEELTFPDSFISQKCTNFQYMFQHCYALKTLNQHFNMIGAYSTTCMLQNCYALEEINTYQGDNGWLFSNVMYCQSMFNHCRALKSLDLHNVSFTRVGQNYDSNPWVGGRSLECMFGNCYALETLNINYLFTNPCRATNISRMFINCHSLTNLTLSSVNFVGLSSSGAQYLFAGCWALKSIDLKYSKFIGLTSLQGWFQYCYELDYIDWFRLTMTTNDADISPITNMSQMFQGCRAMTKVKFIEDSGSIANNMEVFITEINMTTWEVRNVTNVDYMFAGCTNLISVDWAYSNFKRIQTSQYTFDGCTLLEEVIFPEGYSSLVGLNENINRNYSYMFRNCISLTYFEYPNLIAMPRSDTSSYYTYIVSMFEGCTNLHTIEFRNVTNMRSWSTGYTKDCFKDCPALTRIYFSECSNNQILNNEIIRCICNGANANSQKIKVIAEGSINNNFESILRDAIRIKWVDFSNLTNSPTSLNYAFYNTAIDNLDNIKMNFSNVINYQYLCYNSNVEMMILNTSNWNMREGTNWYQAFYGCKATLINATQFSANKVTNFDYGMANCTNLVTVQLPQFNININYLLRYNSNLRNAEFISYDDTEKIRNIISGMYDTNNVIININNFLGTRLAINGYSRVKGFDIYNSDTSIITNLANCFNDTRITSFDFDLLDVTNVTTMQAMFANNPSLTNIHFGKMHTPYLTTIRQMFWYDRAITELDMSEWTFSTVTDLYGLFYYCDKLNTIDISGWDFSAVNSTSEIFRYATSLRTIYARGVFKNFNSDTNTYLSSTGVTSIYIPLSLFPTYKTAYQWKNVLNAFKDGSDKELVSINIESNAETLNCYKQDVYDKIARLTPVYIDPDDNIDVDPQYRGVIWSIEGNAIIDTNGLVKLVNASDGDTLIITATSIYDNNITATKILRVILIQQEYIIDLNNNEWANSGTQIDGHTVYYSSKHTNQHNTTDTCMINIDGYDTFIIKYCSYGEPSYDYLIMKIDAQPTTSSYNYTTFGNSNMNYKEARFENLGGTTHTIYIAYRKDSSVNSNTDKGYFYIPEQN